MYMFRKLHITHDLNFKNGIRDGRFKDIKNRKKSYGQFDSNFYLAFFKGILNIDRLFSHLSKSIFPSSSVLSEGYMFLRFVVIVLDVVPLLLLYWFRLRASSNFALMYLLESGQGCS